MKKLILALFLIFVAVNVYGQKVSSVVSENPTFTSVAVSNTLTLQKDVLTGVAIEGGNDTCVGENQTGVIITSQGIANPYETHTVTFYNTLITTGSIIVASISDDTNTGGIPVIRKQSISAGVVIWTIVNMPNMAQDPSAFNGTLKISYILNP